LAELQDPSQKLLHFERELFVPVLAGAPPSDVTATRPLHWNGAVQPKLQRMLEQSAPMFGSNSGPPIIVRVSVAIWARAAMKRLPIRLLNLQHTKEGGAGRSTRPLGATAVRFLD
jgi:hypothetical protein